MPLAFRPLEIPPVVVIEYERFVDDRGFLAESYRQVDFEQWQIPPFVQDNRAQSVRGVLRGLHYQINPAAVGKLIHCVQGAVFDVAVDLRRGSPTFGRWVGLELRSEHCRMLYVPPGFAHGYCVLSERAEVLYKLTGYYSPPHDRCLLWSDPELDIKWPIREPLLSRKDATAPHLREAELNFTYP